MTNLITDLPDARTGEVFEDLAKLPGGARIERIVSLGQASPPGFWYDQAWDEWVVVLDGWARLRLAGEAEARLLAPGDHVHLPAHCRHRVDATAPDRPTVWVAVHAPPARGK
ncbi:cupin domain-containing protein [Verticiella sediminum]|uniref:Cupin domain-containing protein n=1 Tax=Verticiella sediminum TaxID=1247510 RepID=A0A556AKK8_9BURK|nr:cupin domain-containing protein [Verticiella sediminum]TSH93416.1 cupin domain-containing protein [Verticiella sediminum]